MRRLDSTEVWIGLWILAVLLLAGTGFLLTSRWDEIPERFPVHWNAQDEPDAWADRSPGSVASPLFLGAGWCSRCSSCRSSSSCYRSWPTSPNFSLGR